jgi:hypothetical protein
LRPIIPLGIRVLPSVTILSQWERRILHEFRDRA